MGICILSTTTLQQIDKISRTFLWQGAPAKKRLHLINWDIVILLGLPGGLGILQASFKNYALLTSLFWRCFHTQSDSLWARLLKSKYLKCITPSTLVCKNSNSSFIWKGLM